MAGGRDRAALPTGTVTLVLGDVEGSTRLWEEQPEDVAHATAALDVTISELVGRHGGARPVEQGEGDSFVAAFANTADAVTFALDVQRATAGGLLRLRLGVNTGDVRMRDGGNYAGPTINRAARVRDAGHGGQVLLSQTAADLAADVLPPGAWLEDLGRHRLRDLDRPEQLWQLQHPDIARAFPPLRVAAAVRTNVVAQLTTFIGRSDELATLHDLVEADPCVTVTGAGGCGKTRIALELATGRLEEHAGVWFVDLAAIDTDEAVAPAVADAMGLALADDRIATRRVQKAIGDDDVLLVLDNCEHVLGACRAFTETLLRGCPGLRVLATSREPMGVSGEVTYRLPSMAAPTACELFVERARRASPSFDPGVEDAATIEEICARLDGIPLALELAAARVRVFTLAQVLEGLHDRFRLLTGGARSALPRQRTLEASVEWSHGLLLEPERVLLRRLAAFADGFTLDAAAAIASMPPLEPHHVLDLVVQLVDKSLVVADERGSGRFHLLETVRQYALSKLIDAAEAEEVRRRHYGHFLSVVELPAGAVDWTAADQSRVQADDANVRRALQWASEQDDPHLLDALCHRLFGYWVLCRTSDGARWTGAVRVDDDRISAAERAAALARHARLVGLTGNWVEGVALGEAALAAARVAGDERTVAASAIGLVLAKANVTGADHELLDEAITLARRHDLRPTLALALFHRGFLLTRAGAGREGVDALHEALAMAEADGLVLVARMARATLAMTGPQRGEVAAALPRLDAAIEECDAAQHHSFLANALAIRAGVRAAAGDDAGADDDLARVHAITDLAGDPHLVFIEGIGAVYVLQARGRFTEIVALLGELDGPVEGDLGTAAFGIRALAEACTGDIDAAEADCDAIPADAHTLRTDLLVLLTRAVIARHRGHLDRAWELARDLVGRRPDDEGPAMLDHVLWLLADVAGRTGRFEEAARLLGAAAARFGSVGQRTDGPTVAFMAGDAEAAARAALGDDRFEELWTRGRALDWDAVREHLQRGRGSRSRPAIGWGSLTPTEREVVALVLDGLANKEIAARLFMSVATVKSHLTHTYAKLGVASRSQLAAAARDSRPPTSGR